MRGAGNASRIVRARLRDLDHDRYLAALFAPSTVRGDLIALYAANAELARIGRAVSEPLLGEIRLQWWRDTLQAARSGQMSGDPVADAFTEMAVRRALDPSRTSDLIDARSFDVSGEIMPDMRALKTYLGKTHGSVFLLAARILGEPEGPALERAAEAAGMAYGIMQIVRRLPADLSRGIVCLPRDRLNEPGMTPEMLVTEEGRPLLQPMLAELRHAAREALASAQDHVRQLRPQTRLAFLPLALVEPYLAAAETSDPLGQTTELSPLTKLWRLWRAV